MVSEDSQEELKIGLDASPEGTARDAALAILHWAKEHHFLAPAPMEESAEAVEDESEMQPQKMFSAVKVQDVFRRRAVNLVGFNEPEKKVVIFTKGKISASEKKLLPFSQAGMTIEYMQGGVAQVRGNPPPPQRPRPYFEHNGRYCCGSSIFPANCLGAGTLGLLARDQNGILFGVTNNHVTGACNHAQPGLPILAPGPLDVSHEHLNPFTIGRHVRLLPINDGIPENIDISVNWDACCFNVEDGDRITSMQGNSYDTPATIADPLPGMAVEKVGRTTGHTSGKIVAQSVSPVPVAYSINEYGVKKTVFFDTVFIIEGAGAPFSRGGDSGSLVVHTNGASRVAVGLVFAGNEQNGLSFMLPLAPIMAKLDLEIVAGYNV